MIILRFALNYQDHLIFNYYRQWTAPHLQRQRLLYYVKFIGFIITGFFLLHLLPQRPVDRFSLITYSAVLAMAILLVPDIVKSSIRKQVKKLLDDPANASYLAPTEMVISGNGLAVKDQYSDQNFAWSAFIKKEETKDYYYLYLSTITVIMIPKRVFSSEEERKRFDLYLSEYISLQAEFSQYKNK